MTKRPSLPDIDLYPPFGGFPREGLTFLRQLKRNNRRDWFEKHRDEYESQVREPMLSLIAALRPHFARFAPEFDIDPKRSIFRIYRDVRFSTDKSPYKTHVAAHFVLRGTAKGVSGSGYYLEINPEETYVGGGIYMPDGAQLRNIRQAIAKKGKEFEAIVASRSFKRTFGLLEGERLKRMPAGYDETHPMAQWLKYKQFFAGMSTSASACTKESFASDVAAVCETLAPLVRFLNAALGY